MLKNTDLTLACVAQGDPLPTISWEHNGRGVDPNDAHITILDSGNLTITMVMLTDMGFYQCIATNALGFDESDTVMVTVLGQFNYLSFCSPDHIICFLSVPQLQPNALCHNC